MRALFIRQPYAEVNLRGFKTVSAAYRWHLADVERSKKPREPRGRPRAASFEPF